MITRDKIFKFELDKCYEHSINGHQLHICGEANTIAVGKTYMVEVGNINGTEDHFPVYNIIDLYDEWYKENENWIEIPKDKFILCNYQSDEKSKISMMENIKVWERYKKLNNIKNKIH